MKYQTLLENFKEVIMRDPYRGSQNEWFKNLSSKRKGKAGELMVGATLESMGVSVCSSKQARKDKLVDSSVKLSDYDLYLRSLNLRAEVKTSTMWGEGKNFTFQQIRDQDYDVILFQFILPNEVKLFYCTKEDAVNYIMIDGHGQHGGGKATETFWITFDLDNVPNYIIPITELLPNE
jgi:hypothetical protein